MKQPDLIEWVVGKLDREYVSEWARELEIQEKVDTLLSSEDLPNLT